MKILFTGGGTMGHVTPALAMAEEILDRSKENECVFVGRSGGRENDVIQKRGYPLHTLEVSGILGKGPVEVVSSLSKLQKARKTARELLGRISPDAVVGTGGYVCYPIVTEAAKRKIPVLLHESNATPGLTTRLLARKAQIVMLGIAGSEDAFGRGVKTVYTGTPVRRELYGCTQESAKRRLGLTGRRVILTFGGSLGAECLNALFLRLWREACTKHTVWIHASGTRYYDTVLETVAKEKSCDRYRLLPFIDDMPTYLCAADAVISRAGACTIAEEEAVGLYPLLIPSPNVTGNHQYHNAKRLADEGRAILVEESQLTTEEAQKHILSYLTESSRKRRGDAAKQSAAKAAVDRIADVVKSRSV